MASDTCTSCGRPKAECHQQVDRRFPKAAQKAFAARGLTIARTCPKGQASDVTRTGWNWDRARFSKEWAGRQLTQAERRGRGFELERMEREAAQP